MIDTDTVSIAVRAFNDPPVNIVPPSVTIDEDSTLVFSAGGEHSVFIQDPDSRDDDIAVEVFTADVFGDEEPIGLPS